jgi:hypothetical protein
MAEEHSRVDSIAEEDREEKSMPACIPQQCY